MNLIPEMLIKNKKILNEVSSYNPNAQVKERIKDIQEQMSIADEIRNTTFREFNNRTLLQYQDDCQKAFNNYVPPASSNEDEAWRANTIRPVSRNKVISIAAHITSGIMEPIVEAQNEKAVSDRDAAMVMKDLMDFVLSTAQYPRKFVFGVISALVNPAVIFNLEYLEVIRKFKEIQEDGTWKEKEMLDEVFSGFNVGLTPVEELFIGDAYENDIQKQPFLIRRKIIDYNYAKIKYGTHKDFKHVKAGVRNFFNSGNSTFYETNESDLGSRKVEEVIFYDRYADLEIPLVNGIMMTDDPDRPMQRMDKKYPFAKSGYELIDEGRFFYYKSLVDKMSPDQTVIDTLYNMVIDGTFLSVFPPTANYGGEEVRSNVMIPGVTTNFTDPNAKLAPINPPINLSAGMNTLDKVESSLSESSQDPRSAGQQSPGSTTAFEVARLEENAKSILGLFGKMIGFLVEDLGTLLTASILQYMTVAEVEDVVGDAVALTYKSVLVADREVDGKTINRRIDFEMPDENMQIKDQFQVPGLDPTQQQALQQSSELQAQGKELGMSIAKVNPELFRNRKYKVKSKADFMKSTSEAIRKALNLEAYDRAIANPLANQEAIYKEFLLKNYVPGDEEKFVQKAQPQGMPMGKPAGTDTIKQILGVGQPTKAQMV
jgi:hypothetical protein